MAVAVVVFMAIGAASVYGIYKPRANGSDDGVSRSSSAAASVEDRGLPRRSSAGAKAGEVAPLELLTESSHRS